MCDHYSSRRWFRVGIHMVQIYWPACTTALGLERNRPAQPASGGNVTHSLDGNVSVFVSLFFIVSLLYKCIHLVWKCGCIYVAHGDALVFGHMLYGKWFYLCHDMPLRVEVSLCSIWKMVLSVSSVCILGGNNSSRVDDGQRVHACTAWYVSCR